MSNNTQNRPETAVAQPATGKKLLIIVGLVAAALLLSYNYASAKTAGSAPGFAAALAPAAGVAGGGGDGCCGGGGAPVEAAAVVEGDVQKLAVDTSTGSFNPNVIKAKAGVPIELTFSQSPGGCLSGVLIPDFNISEDLTTGAKTVTLPALEKGEYQFSCQMQMVTGTIVVE